MSAYIIRRLWSMIPTLLIATVVVFLLIRLMPGDVIDTIIEDLQNRGTSEAAIAATRAFIAEELGLDVPAPLQYARWLGILPQADGRISGILQGDFGLSLWSKKPVLSRIAPRWPVTLELGLMALVVSQLISLPIGIYSALRQDTVGDYLARSFAFALIAVPNFWIATLVVVLPSIWWGYTPPIMLIRFGEDPLGNLQMFILPAVVLGMGMSGMTMRMTRTMMLEVLRQDYIRTAWSKGLRERLIVMRHALKNAFIPVITQIGLLLAVADRRYGHHREHIRPARHGAAHSRRHRQARLRDGERADAAGSRRHHGDQPRRGPGVRLAGPEDPLPMSGAPEQLNVANLEVPRTRSLWVDAARRLFTEKPLGAIGAVVTVALLFTGLFADLIAPYGYNEVFPQLAKSPPSARFWLGTDHIGRDMLSRVIYGARISMIVGLAASVVSSIVELVLGMSSGYLGRKVDMILQRFVDAVMGFPGIVLLVVVMSLVGPGHGDNHHRAGAALGHQRIAHHPRRRALHQEQRLRRRRHRHRLPHHAGADPAYPAAHRGAADHQLQHAGAGHHPHRGEPELPRLRRAAASAELGRHAQRPGPRTHARRAMDRDLAGRRAERGRVWREHARRCRA